MRPMRSLARSGGWLIFYTHGVKPEPGRWGCTPQQLEQLFSLARAQGCELLSVGQALEYFQARGGGTVKG